MSLLGARDPAQRTRRVVILAGKKSHGPDGNGVHDYPAQARLLHDCLQRSALASQLAITRAEDDTWPAAAVAEADVLVVIGDGRDGDLPYADAGHIATSERIATVAAAVARGAGVLAVHFSTFTPECDMPQVLAWQGACFHWQQDGKREWKSRITWAKGVPDLLTADHPLLRGWGGGALREEYYHRLTFHPSAVPLLAVRALPGADTGEQTVAWAITRPDGGRGCGTTMGHSVDSLRHDGLRTLLLNSVVWAAGIEVPEGGLKVPFSEREHVEQRLGLRGDVAPIRVAVLAGNAAHRWHNWPESTAALLRAWGDDPRITARVHTDPADLATALADRDVLVLNWVNWQDPAGIPDAAKAAIQAFTERGGGVFIHHFADGACHASLPHAAASDWPWYRTLVRRVWEHRALGPGPSSHDRFRAFEVKPLTSHPLVAGMPACTVEDELYWRQHGDEPITPLLTARSEETGADEPLVWAYEVGKGRVVQSLLGHSAKTYEPAPLRALVRRIIAWCANRSLHGAMDGSSETVARW